MFDQTSNPVYSEIIHKTRYARYLPEKKRRENWEETVARWASFWKERYPEYSELFDEVLAPAIYNLDVMASMRTLMTAGKALARDEVAGYNCSYTACDNPRVFDEVMYLLACGVGVGFSVERQNIQKLPTISEEFHDTDSTIVVGDSKIGWASAFRELISLLYSGKIPKWDLSKVRPAGAPLKTFGGRASGPEPLEDLFRYTTEVFKEAAGRKLTSVECHGILCKIGEIIVVGGTRRSACISLSNLSDDRMRHAKSGQWWNEHPEYALANNSAVYTEKPDIEIFMKEWLSLIESKSGERGISNRHAIQTQMRKQGRRDAEHEFGTNPCQPGNATVLTPDGIRTFDDIDIGSVIWSGKRWTKVINKWSTGFKPVYKYNTTFGYFLGTENHRIVQEGEKIEVKDAESIDISTGEMAPAVIHHQDVIDGLIIGDGSVHKASNNLVHLYIGEKDTDYFSDPVKEYLVRARPGIAKGVWEVNTTISWDELPKTYLRTIPDRFYYGTPSVKAGFLRGLFSANGSVCGKRITLKQSSYRLVQQVQEMLSSMGIRSYITTNRSKRNFFNNGRYKMKESYDLNITTGRTQFRDQIGFIQNYKQEVIIDSGKIKSQTSPIESVEYLGYQDVFDITVDDKEHTYWTGGCLVSNCGEIFLRSNQTCNLSEVVVRAGDTYEDLKRKVELATIIGTFQATLTNFRYLRKKWRDNIEEEALLGVSLTGIMDHPVLNGSEMILITDESGYTQQIDLPELLERLQDVAYETNKEWAEKLGINQATAITTVKPSGTVSQLVDSSSGIHPRYSPYYIRTIRQDKKDPLSLFLREQGFPVEDDFHKPDATDIFSFPIKSPEGAIYRDDRTAIEQLELYLIYRKHWTEHNPSITVYVKDDEWLKVGAWVYEHFDEVSGVSFLPHTNHSYKQAPYQEVSKEEYEEFLKKIPEGIDWESFKEVRDETTSSQELACTGGQCEIN